MNVFLLLFLIITHICKCVLELVAVPIQLGHTPLHSAAEGGYTTCVKQLLSTPGIEVNIKDWVSWSTEY